MAAQLTSYIKVDGDVTQDYALDLIERQAPAGPMRLDVSRPSWRAACHEIPLATLSRQRNNVGICSGL